MICGHCGKFSAGRIAELEAHCRTCRGDARWAKVAELRRAGQSHEAESLARKLLGVKGAPMTEEDRARIRE